MAAVANPVVTEEEYLALAEKSDVKLEFVGGKILAMAGGSLDHGTLSYRVGAALSALADAKGCRGFNSDVRIKVKDNGQYVYPDLSFSCRRAEREGTSLLNHTLIVEVLSPSTADHDRGDKWELYQSLSSLEEYLMVHSESVRAELYRRHGDVWLYESVRGMDGRVEVLGGSVRLAELYRDVDFSTKPEPV